MTSRKRHCLFAAAFLLLPITAGAQTYTYDTLGRVSTVTHPNGAKTVYYYDTVDNRVGTQTATNGVITLQPPAPPNSPPTCSNWNLYISGVPAMVNSITVTLTSANATDMLSKCSDPEGGALTLVSPTLPYSKTFNRSDSPKHIPFSVADPQGALGSAVVNVSF